MLVVGIQADAIALRRVGLYSLVEVWVAREAERLLFERSWEALLML